MKQTERQVTHECIGWLRSLGWVCRRQHVGTYQPISGGPIVSMGEDGECDWHAKRGKPQLDYFEIEFKATGAKPKQKQLEYMAKRRHQGFNATWADSLEMLKRWYAEKYATPPISN